jgi:hypothetical protein
MFRKRHTCFVYQKQQTSPVSGINVPQNEEKSDKWKSSKEVQIEEDYEVCHWLNPLKIDHRKETW